MSLAIGSAGPSFVSRWNTQSWFRVHGPGLPCGGESNFNAASRFPSGDSRAVNSGQIGALPGLTGDAAAPTGGRPSSFPSGVNTSIGVSGGNDVTTITPSRGGTGAAARVGAGWDRGAVVPGVGAAATHTTRASARRHPTASF